MSIPLFDSLSHPTISGEWFERGVDASFSTLSKNLLAANFRRACAVGIAGHEGYNHRDFAERCRKYPELVPIAGVDPKETKLIEAELDTIYDLGFRGIKLHPRRSGFSYSDPRMIDTFRAATRRGLPVFLCTYFHAPVDRYPDADPLYAIVHALKAAPDTRLVLLHGGTVELMRWMQFARHNENVLFDISYTMMQYRNSSLDQDLKWLFHNFHDRTCFGVDHPEWRHSDVRARFEELAHQAPAESARKIGGMNIARFLGVDFD